MNRFWSKVEKTDSCWIWKSGKKQGTHRYGIFFDGVNDVKAHRFAWEIFHGKVPENFKVLHRCDNPPCVNPNHLFIGSQKENIKDALKKGRMCNGINSPFHKIDENNVRDIKKLYGNNFSSRKIGSMYGLAHSTVLNIVKGVKWKHFIPL